MSSRIKSKNSSVGFVEIIQNGSWYELWVGGSLKQQSADLNYILSEYDRIY